ncbi:bifunctional UDP-sugar hydrolase/5'-nucleotidase [Aquincola sp. S2]|uniref:Bifunctional UDP-sugar hydrolase/5'-nucleotidase n=1 Tax=Pseudaquabacterium terrae TaxID=2732868 RepID=A0ABX2EMC1_9BURK|nr:bifunctional UDP-sugar hydrolase/5'-nucleotidase [Aquabacterium terrae]NRF69783.1 bifunctional UDP-sugar hydrolase/5'-nucleotidase [Aquabacterium terrae]
MIGRRFVLITVAALLGAGCHTLQTPLQTPLQAPPPVRLTVLHTNDHHGRFWRSADGEHGLAARKTIVDGVRAELAAHGGAVLLLDAGDVNTGTPESDLLDAEPDFRGMSALGVDAMAVGNHEFDKTQAVLERQRREWSSFPWLAANVSRSGQPAFEPYRIFQRGPLRIAVLGLTTEDSARMDLGARHPGLQFERPAASAQRWLPRLKSEADVIIVLSHLGHYPDGRHGSSAPGDVELAREVSGIHLIVGGHSHSAVCMRDDGARAEPHRPGEACRPDRQNGAWIVQSGDRGRFIGRADFEWRDGRLELLNYALLPVNLRGAPPVAEDPQMLALLTPFADSGRTTLSVPIGRVTGHFDGERASVRHRPTNLGRLITQLMQQAAEADVALVSSGGIRDSLREGEVRLRDLLQVLPFGNRLVIVTLDGRELADYLLAAARKTPGSGAYPQFSGARFRFDGAALHELHIGGAPIEPARRYRLALSSFVAAGGDGYPDLRRHPGYVDTGRTDVALLRAAFERRGVLAAADFEAGTR